MWLKPHGWTDRPLVHQAYGCSVSTCRLCPSPCVLMHTHKANGFYVHTCTHTHTKAHTHVHTHTNAHACRHSRTAVSGSWQELQGCVRAPQRIPLSVCRGRGCREVLGGVLEVWARVGLGVWAQAPGREWRRRWIGLLEKTLGTSVENPGPALGKPT